MPPLAAEVQDLPKVPACDWCREKKIRCGREKPQCRNCTQRRIQCIYSDRPKRENENTRTAHLFDEVHSRLDRIERTLALIAAAHDIKNGHSTRMRSRDRERSPKSYSHSFRAQRRTYRESLESSSGSKSPSEQEEVGDIEPDICHLALPSQTQDSANRAPSAGAQSASFVEDVEGNAHYFGGTSFLAISSEAADGAQAAAKSPSPSSAASLPIQPGDISQIQEKVGKVLEPDVYVTLAHPPEKLNGRRFWIPPRSHSMKIINDYFNGFAWLFPLFDRKKFMRQAEAMYGNLDTAVDVGWLICYLQTVVCGVYGVLNDKDCLTEEYLKGTERVKILQKASKIVWECIDDTSTLLKPRLLNVQALMMLAASANEISRPGLCWMLLCNACSLAKAIGLHRNHSTASLLNSTVKFTSADLAERKYVFWTLYIMDKSLSLTFGRPSSLPDYDIDVPLPEFDPENPLWELYLAWIGTAQIQSEIHVRLYSAQAPKVPHVERQKVIVELDGKLNEWWKKYGILLQRRHEEEMFERRYIMTELVFAYHNTMIMIHRVNTAKIGEKGLGKGPTPEASEERLGIHNEAPLGISGMSTEGGIIRGSVTESEMACLEHARRGINLIRDAISQKKDIAGSSLMMWLFSYYPFTAFFVLFSNSIRYPHLATSKDDYRLLRFVVDFLESHKYVHAGAAKLFPVAQNFLQIAARFVEPSPAAAPTPKTGDHAPPPPPPPPLPPPPPSPSPPFPTSSSCSPIQSPQHVPRQRLLGKRKLDQTSHDPLDDDEHRMGVGPVGLTSDELLMQYHPGDQTHLTPTNFITWPRPPFAQVRSTQAPTVPTTTAEYNVELPCSSSSPGFDYVEAIGGGAGDCIAWGQPAGETFAAWDTNFSGPAAAGLGWQLGTQEAEFQDKVTLAAGEGPLGFDWFGWERWWEGDDFEGGGFGG